MKLTTRIALVAVGVAWIAFTAANWHVVTGFLVADWTWIAHLA